jgi:membrane-associated phospholipid phosphatase
MVALALLSFLLVWLLIIGAFFVRRRLQNVLHSFNPWAAIWIQISRVVFSNIVISILNIYVGRVRPDFYRRCGSEATADSCPMLSNADDLNDEWKSFPSVPAATTVSSTLFFALFFQKIVLRRPTWVSCLALLFVAVGTVEIRLFKYHTDDVVAGFLIGAICTAVIWNGSIKRIFRKLREGPTDAVT